MAKAIKVTPTKAELAAMHQNALQDAWQKGELADGPEPLFHLRIHDGPSHVLLSAKLGFDQAVGRAESLAKSGVWVDTLTFWPPHSITSITLEPITP